jgi:hypothetical protein
MEDKELMELWQASERHLEESRLLNWQSWALNLRSFEYIQLQKARSKLRGLALFKGFAVVLGLIWVFFLGCLFLLALHMHALFLGISLGGILVITAVGVLIYLSQIASIWKINQSESVLDTQSRLADLQASTLRVMRIQFLQIPFYTTFYIPVSVLQRPDLWWAWGLYLLTTGLSVWGTVWLYRHIRLGEVDKRWFRTLFGGFEWSSVARAGEFLRELEEFKREG